MATPLKTRRRNLSISLRIIFVLMTTFAVWLGVIVKRAREQREAVKAIEALGGQVRYDWHYDSFRARRDGVSFNSPLSKSMQAPNGPQWLRQIFGDDFFQHVRAVQIPRAHSIDEYPALNPNDPWDECRGWALRKDLVPPREMEAKFLELIPHLRRLHGLKAVSLPTYIGDFDTSLSRSTLIAFNTSLPGCEVSQFYNGVPLFVP